MYDIIIIGGGINGTGIARDAAGRGLKVLLCEKDDLAQHTSSASSKLIHGGLRYLEYFEFRLVAEALAEREVLWKIAPHIIQPLEFVMPYVPKMRRKWMIRFGLFLYDHLGKRRRLPASRSVRLRREVYGGGFKYDLRLGFVYADCWVDDARLTVLNARSAADLGATVMTRTACVGGKRIDGGWELSLQAKGEAATQTVRSKVVINATGPWVKQVLTEYLRQPVTQNVKQIKGSHIIVPRRYAGQHACILQNEDKRVIFMIPYEQHYTLIGTTEVEVDEPDNPSISEEEVAYLCRAVNLYLAQALRPDEVVLSYSGVRPLLDDGSTNPSAVSRDYSLILDAPKGQAPLLSIYGGKITTYRRVAEQVMTRLGAFFPDLKPDWTASKALPGGDIEQESFTDYVTELAKKYWGLPYDHLYAMARRHGNIAEQILGEAELQNPLGSTLYAAEVDYLVQREWARTAEDVLWRRTKCGMHMTTQQQQAVTDYLRDKHGLS